MKRFPRIAAGACLLALSGSAVLAFGLYNIHSLSGVTEGGILGLTLLLQHWFGVSPAFSNFVLSALCYLLGWRMLGHRFIVYSFVATGGFSLFYAVCERFDPLWPALADMPLLAAVLGALFVGVGAGLAVRAGGAAGGDDALAMALSDRFHVKIETVYLLSDIVILGLSATYIPLPRLLCSFLTVVLSGKLVGIVQRFKLPRRAPEASK